MFDVLPRGSTTKERLDAYSMPVTETGCWLWAGYRNPKGYGVLGIGRATYLAHRASYEEYVEIIPEGLNVLHRCDNPPCINPRHLFLGTQKDNVDDMDAKGRRVIPTKFGQSHGNSRLTDAAVERIAVDLVMGVLPQKKISKKHGLSQQHVSDINRGNIWSHVTGASIEKPLRVGRCTNA